MKIALVSPYSDPVMERAKHYYETRHGLAVVAKSPDLVPVERLSPHQIGSGSVGESIDREAGLVGVRLVVE